MTTSPLVLGVIGAGNMSGAILQGLFAAGTWAPDRVIASDPSAQRRHHLETELRIRTTIDNAQVAQEADVLLLGVKPQGVAHVVASFASALRPITLLVSILAGVSTLRLTELLPATTRIVRAMPNVAALAGAGATALTAGSGATDDDLALARSLFASVGKVVVVDEKLLDAVTALSGSGPAYVMLFIEALTDGAARMGIPYDQARLLATQTVYGAAKLLLETGEHPAVLRERVSSPGGTTLAGLHRLEVGGVRGAVMEAIAAATERAQELGASSPSKR